MSDEVIKQLEEAEKISFNDLWMPPMVKKPKPKYVHNAGIPDGVRRI